MYRLKIAAFTSTPGSSSSIRQAMSDLILSRSHLEIDEGGVASAVRRYSQPGAEAPDLLIVEESTGADGLRHALGELSDYLGESTKVIVIGAVDQIAFYREMMELGIGEYVVSPISIDSFMQALRKVFGGDASASQGRIISVFGAKGGVGTSTFSHNLGWSLAKIYERPVSIVDMDMHFGTVGVDFNSEARNGFRDALSHAQRGEVVDDICLERLFTKITSNIWLLASNPTMDDVTDRFQPDYVQAVLAGVAKISTFTVLDLPHIWTPSITAAFEMSDEIVLVTDASLSGMRNTQLLYDAIIARKPTALVRYVVNGVGQTTVNEISGRDFSETIGTAPVSTLPWNPSAFRSSAEAGKMIAQDKANAKLAAIFDDVARVLSGNRGTEAKAATRKAAAGGSFLAKLMGKK